MLNRCDCRCCHWCCNWCRCFGLSNLVHFGSQLFDTFQAHFFTVSLDIEHNVMIVNGDALTLNCLDIRSRLRGDEPVATIWVDCDCVAGEKSIWQDAEQGNQDRDPAGTEGQEGHQDDSPCTAASVVDEFHLPAQCCLVVETPWHFQSAKNDTTDKQQEREHKGRVRINSQRGDPEENTGKDQGSSAHVAGTEHHPEASERDRRDLLIERALAAATLLAAAPAIVFNRFGRFIDSVDRDCVALVLIRAFCGAPAGGVHVAVFGGVS